MEKDCYSVERCLDGHPADFRHLVRQCQPVLRGLAAMMAGEGDQAEDAAAFDDHSSW